jgi:hypothetical protein
VRAIFYHLSGNSRTTSSRREVEVYRGGGEAIVIAVYSTRWINALPSTLGIFTFRKTG